MPVKQYQITFLRSLKFFTLPKHRPKLDDLIRLYTERKIANYSTALKIAKNLSGNTGAPKVAIQMLEKYYDAPPAKDRNKKVADENNLKTYFIKGKVRTMSKYSKRTNKGTKTYDKEYRDEFPEAKEVRANSLEAAKKLFIQQATADFESNEYSKLTVVEGVDIVSTTPLTAYKKGDQGDTLMKAVKFPKYDFIPSDDKLLLNEGFCVVDQFVGIYGPKIKKTHQVIFHRDVQRVLRSPGDD